MTILDDRPLVGWQQDRPRPAPGRPVGAVGRPLRPVSTRPAGARPPVAPMAYRGAGVGISRAPHGRARVSTRLTVALAGMAALITLWLGSLAGFSGSRAAAPASVPDRLAVVRVQAGETLAQLAERVAPGVPAAQIVDRIRDLNKLDSAAVDAGQTLIAPVS